MGGDRGAHRAAILVVDDQPILRRTARLLLEQHGLEVIEACHGGEALAVYRWHAPAVVLLDLEMPIVDGWTFLRIAERVGIVTPVIIVSGSAQADAAAKASCVVDVVPKPYDAGVLIGAVSRALAGRAGPRSPRE